MRSDRERRIVSLRIVRVFKAEMDVPTAPRTLDPLAALSYRTNLSIGCYRENESRCHTWFSN